MAKRTKRLKPDMTPLIDCVFLLLVFFLVTSVFKQDESVLKLILPEIQSEVKRDVPEGLYIELNKDDMALNGEKADVQVLEQKASEVRNKKSPIAIKIDKETPYERVAAVLDVLQLKKLYNIQLINDYKEP